MNIFQVDAWIVPQLRSAIQYLIISGWEETHIPSPSGTFFGGCSAKVRIRIYL